MSFHVSFQAQKWDGFWKASVSQSVTLETKSCWLNGNAGYMCNCGILPLCQIFVYVVWPFIWIDCLINEKIKIYLHSWCEMILMRLNSWCCNIAHVLSLWCQTQIPTLYNEVIQFLFHCIFMNGLCLLMICSSYHHLTEETKQTESRQTNQQT